MKLYELPPNPSKPIPVYGYYLKKPLVYGDPGIQATLYYHGNNSYFTMDYPDGPHVILPPDIEVVQHKDGYKID